MPLTASGDTHPVSVVTKLYLRTKTLHVKAERSGIINDLLKGEASRNGYVSLMRNLLPAYRAMEAGLERHYSSPVLSELAAYQLNRAGAIEADLDAICGRNWSTTIALLESADSYARRIVEAAQGDGARLIAHAYTRYLGDLSGGLILQKLLMRSLSLQPAELSFYSFPQFSDLALLKSNYRAALDRSASNAIDQDAIVEEGAAAFLHNIDLSCAVKNSLTSAHPMASAEN